MYILILRAFLSFTFSETSRADRRGERQIKLAKSVRAKVPPVDPLSPYLFIIALETLTIKIRNDDSIKGFKIGGETTKLTICFVRDKESYASLFAILESFGSCSGLGVNHEKNGDFSTW